MYITSVSNVNFGAGKIKLGGIKSGNLISNYKKIENLAKKKNVDLAIIKHSDFEYLPDRNIFTVIASKEIDKPPYVKHGADFVVVNKSDKNEAVSDSIFGAISKAIDKIYK